MNVSRNKRMEEEKKESSAWTLGTDRYRAEDAPPNPAKLTDLDFEYQAAAEAAGKEQPVYGVWGKLWKLYNRLARKREKVQVSKKAYLWLLALTGWMGGHRYYERRWVLGIVYTAFCWTGVPLAMCVIDAMAVIPIKADESGRIQL